MLDELVARVSSPEELLGLSQTQLDGVVLSCIACRANSTDPIASKFVYEDEMVGLYPVGIGTTYQQRTQDGLLSHAADEQPRGAFRYSPIAKEGEIDQLFGSGFFAKKK